MGGDMTYLRLRARLACRSFMESRWSVVAAIVLWLLPAMLIVWAWRELARKP
jgi:uncharacterized membrane protein (GlpM family)